MKIAVTGSSGLIGTALVTSLHAAGHDVLRLVRRPPRAADEVTWEPSAGTIDLERLAGIDAAVHLAGAGVGDHRWTDEYKRTILDSRVDGTRTLAKALTALDPMPRVLVSASAVGFYGSRGDEILTEASPPGQGFLADVVRAWESETQPAADAGIRVARIRTGLVMAPNGPAFARLLTLIKFGLGGPLGDGRQWWPWITLEDEIGAIRFLLEEDVAGPVNLTGPEPAPQREIVEALARLVRRPALLPAPRFGLKLVLGEFAEDVLASQRVVPTALEAAGYRFHQPTLGEAARWLVRQS